MDEVWYIQTVLSGNKDNCIDTNKHDSIQWNVNQQKKNAKLFSNKKYMLQYI